MYDVKKLVMLVLYFLQWDVKGNPHPMQQFLKLAVVNQGQRGVEDTMASGYDEGNHSSSDSTVGVGLSGASSNSCSEHLLDDYQRGEIGDSSQAEWEDSNGRYCCPPPVWPTGGSSGCCVQSLGVGYQ